MFLKHGWGSVWACSFAGVNSIKNTFLMPTEEMVKLMLGSTVETLDLGLQAQTVHKMRLWFVSKQHTIKSSKCAWLWFVFCN